MADSDFEGDVAAPLARFRPKTKWYIRLATVLLFIQMGTTFSLILVLSEQKSLSFNGAMAVPALIIVATEVLKSLAHSAEREGNEDEVASLMSVLFKLIFALGTFFYGYLWFTH